MGRKDAKSASRDFVEVTIRDKSGAVAERLAPLANSARLTAAEKAAAARGWATPRVTAARGRVANDYVPRIVEAINSAIVASEPVRTEAMTRGTLAWAALKGEPVQVVQPKRRRLGRVGRLLAFLGLAGAAASAVAWWRSQQQPVAPWEDTGSAASRSTVYPATGGTGATGASSADTVATGATMGTGALSDTSTPTGGSTSTDTGSGGDTAEPPGPVLSTAATGSALDSEGDEDLTTPSTAMGTTSESTSADPAGDSTSQSPSPDDASTMDTPAKTTRARAGKSTRSEGL